MELKLIRKWKKPNYTIGNLYVNDEWFCNTVEDVDRDINSTMSKSDIANKKVYGETAIPTGKYEVTLDVVSGKFGTKNFYKNYANDGKLPRLLNVPGFEGVLIHCGNTAKDSLGCLIVGLNKIKGGVTNSQDTFKKLYPLLYDVNQRGEKITIEII